MKRFLLISDTHGELELLQALIEETKVDAVIHAGDFGFYDNESIHRLQTRELRLLITHSAINTQYYATKETPRDQLIEIIKTHKLLGSFPEYLARKKVFSVPVYAVWGNHEDLSVLKALRKNNAVENLFLLDENHFYDISGIRLCGIGGNWLPDKRLFGPPLSGSGGKIWATLAQFGILFRNMQHFDGPCIFVSHVSPGKEPLLVRLMSHFAVDLWISGHMGAAFQCLWNPFTVRDEAEELEWLSKALPVMPQEITEDAKLAYDLLQKPMPSLETIYRKQWYLNLTDAGQGHAILTVHQGELSLQTHARGLKHTFKNF